MKSITKLTAFIQQPCAPSDNNINNNYRIAENFSKGFNSFENCTTDNKLPINPDNFYLNEQECVPNNNMSNNNMGFNNNSMPFGKSNYINTLQPCVLPTQNMSIPSFNSNMSNNFNMSYSSVPLLNFGNEMNQPYSPENNTFYNVECNPAPTNFDQTNLPEINFGKSIKTIIPLNQSSLNQEGLNMSIGLSNVADCFENSNFPPTQNGSNFGFSNKVPSQYAECKIFDSKNKLNSNHGNNFGFSNGPCVPDFNQQNFNRFSGIPIQQKPIIIPIQERRQQNFGLPISTPHFNPQVIQVQNTQPVIQVQKNYSN